jgi:hypothetical protein
MNFGFDPLVSLSIIMLQVSNRYMRINITPAQEKILMHPITQISMYASIIYFTTKNILLTLFIVIISYLFLVVLFNENHRLNILPKDWLYKEKLSDVMSESSKEMYKNNLEKYHYDL